MFECEPHQFMSVSTDLKNNKPHFNTLSPVPGPVFFLYMTGTLSHGIVLT